jgi:hypothetical protein
LQKKDKMLEFLDNPTVLNSVAVLLIFIAIINWVTEKQFTFRDAILLVIAILLFIAGCHHHTDSINEPKMMIKHSPALFSDTSNNK